MLILPNSDFDTSVFRLTSYSVVVSDRLRFAAAACRDTARSHTACFQVGHRGVRPRSAQCEIQGRAAARVGVPGDLEACIGTGRRQFGEPVEQRAGVGV